MTNDDLHSFAKESSDVVRIERLTHHIQRIREDQHADPGGKTASGTSMVYVTPGEGL